MGCAGDAGANPFGALELMPVRAFAAPTVLVGAAADSSNVPHAPHSGQRPNHFGDEYPHSVQVWTVRCFTTALVN